jgi:CRP/FNR family transcriptional regulator
MVAFDAIQRTSAYPEGSLLFLEGEESRGVYVICQGTVTISKTALDGKTLILKIAKAGETLGLSSVLTGLPYMFQAETLSPCQLAFVRREDFLQFLANNPQAYSKVVEHLSLQYQEICERACDLVLTTSIAGKIAKLLLDWTKSGERPNTDAQTRWPLTHEKIAEYIGSSRETVTRVLGDLRDRDLVQLRSSILTVRNREALEVLARN